MLNQGIAMREIERTDTRRIFQALARESARRAEDEGEADGGGRETARRGAIDQIPGFV